MTAYTNGSEKEIRSHTIGEGVGWLCPQLQNMSIDQLLS